MSDVVERNQRHYDSITDAWPWIFGESFHWGLFLDDREDLATATTNLIEAMRSMCRFPPAARVLDVGCGIGGPAVHLASSSDCTITGISISPAGVARANELASRSGLADRLDFIVGDAMRMDLPDAAFDVAWVMESSHLMPDKDRLIAECRRVLRPGGALVLCDLMFTRYPRAKEVIELKDDLEVLSRAFGHARLNTLGHYQRLLETHRFVGIQTRDVSKQVTPTLTHWRANIETNWPRLSSVFSEAQKADFLASCHVLERLFENARWGYGLISAIGGEA